jgi:signal peptidase I
VSERRDGAPPTLTADPPPDDAPAERSDKSFWRELPVLVAIALLIAILIKSFLIQAFYIPSPSMEPTLVRGDRVLGVAQPEDEDFIKRVVGLPGDVVEVRRGNVFVNAERLDEPYLDEREDTRSFAPRTIPDGMLFVMGDNRLVSGDSRFEPPTGVGLVPEDRVIGVAFVRVWPPSRWGWI